MVDQIIKNFNESIKNFDQSEKVSFGKITRLINFLILMRKS